MASATPTPTPTPTPTRTFLSCEALDDAAADEDAATADTAEAETVAGEGGVDGGVDVNVTISVAVWVLAGASEDVGDFRVVGGGNKSKSILTVSPGSGFCTHAVPSASASGISSGQLLILSGMIPNSQCPKALASGTVSKQAAQSSSVFLMSGPLQYRYCRVALVCKSRSVKDNLALLFGPAHTSAHFWFAGMMSALSGYPKTHQFKVNFILTIELSLVH